MLECMLENKIINSDLLMNVKKLFWLVNSQNKQTLPHRGTSLWICYMKNCWKMFIISGIFKLFGDLCGLIGPLSISFIVEFINLRLLNENSTATTTTAAIFPEVKASGASGKSMITSNSMLNLSRKSEIANKMMINYPNWTDFIGNGWIMSCIVLISFLLQGTFSQASTNLINMEGIKIKNALQGLIYRKTLSLSASCFCNSTTSQSDTDNENSKNPLSNRKKVEENCDVNNNPGTITNLMSEDSLNVMSFFWICHYVWSIPLKVKAEGYFYEILIFFTHLFYLFTSIMLYFSH